MSYGCKMKELRNRFGISQKRMAEILNISDSLYSRYEKEKQDIPIKHLISFCDYFNVSIDFIFDFNDLKNYNENVKTIDFKIAGTRLKEFRKENKITQDKLAKYLNTTHSVISDYERGRYLIATPFLYTICKKYNVSADYLLGKINKNQE